jgi:hypothetical protein
MAASSCNGRLYTSITRDCLCCGSVRDQPPASICCAAIPLAGKQPRARLNADQGKQPGVDCTDKSIRKCALVKRCDIAGCAGRSWTLQGLLDIFQCLTMPVCRPFCINDQVFVLKQETDSRIQHAIRSPIVYLRSICKLLSKFTY